MWTSRKGEGSEKAGELKMGYNRKCQRLVSIFIYRCVSVEKERSRARYGGKEREGKRGIDNEARRQVRLVEIE